MSKLEFALQSSLVLAIVSHGFVTGQTRTTPQQESASVQEAHRTDVRGRQDVEPYKEYDFGLEPSPEEAKKFYKQGVKYGRMKLFTEAVAAFELAILLKPNYTDAYFGLGHAYFDLGRWEESIQAFRRVIELDPEDTEAYVRLHQINERMARDEKMRIYSQPPPRTLTNSRTEMAVAKPSPLNDQPKPESRLSSTVNSPPASNRNVAPSVKLRAVTNPMLPQSRLRLNLWSRIAPDRGAIPRPMKNSATAIRVNPDIPPPPSISYRPVANAKATMTAVTNPMLPQSRLRLNLSSRIAPDRGAVPKPMKSSATAIPVNLDAAPQPSISSRSGPDAAATKSAVNKSRDGGMPKTAPDKTQELSDSAIPATPPSNDDAAAVGVGVASPVKRATSKSSSNAASSSPIPEPMSEVAIYRVGIGDVLEVRVSDAPANNPTVFTVSAGGLLDYPVLSQPLPVLGLTPDEIGEKLKAELQRRALTEAQNVVVAVRDYNSHTILVGGLVNEQGTKVLRREAIPLYVVLAEAQPNPEAGRVAVISQAGSKTTNVDLSDPGATALLIHPGDVVLVEAKPKLFFYIGGEVKEPGEKPFREDLKLTQAILKAGGLTRVSKAAEVAREGANGLLEVTVYKLSDINSGKIPDPIIKAGDRITIVH